MKSVGELARQLANLFDRFEELVEFIDKDVTDEEVGQGRAKSWIHLHKFSETEFFVVEGVDNLSHPLNCETDVFTIRLELFGGRVADFEGAIDCFGCEFARLQSEENTG